jgi:hypothetical protein
LTVQDFVKHFIRDGIGRWNCVEPAVVDLPVGHIEVAPGTRLVRGTNFMGVDVAKLLDDEYNKEPRARYSTSPMAHRP